MKKDIKIPKVEHVTVAITKHQNEHNEDLWEVYLLNRNQEDIHNTLVASKGYGEQNGENQATSILRHFLETVPAGSASLIEPINTDIFHLTNEYWVSYYIGSRLYDKKFLFLPDSIKEEHLSYIKELDREGVLHS